MPAASDPQAGGPGHGHDQDPEPVLPATFRPFGVRVAAVVLEVLLFTVLTVIWLAFPESVRDQFTVFQRLTLLAFGLAAAAAGYALARSRVEAREEGLLLVNGYRTRLYPWNEVSRVFLRSGGPWVVVELADGETAAAMGIQGSDGKRALAQVRQLREIVDSRTSAS